MIIFFLYDRATTWIYTLSLHDALPISIVKTNADYVDGSRITLLEMDVMELLSDEAKLKALQSKIGSAGGPESLSLSTVRPLLKDIKGIKIDGPSISVEFR